MLGSASGGFRRCTRYREDIQRVRRRFGGAKRCSEAFVHIRGVGRRPGHTGRRPRSALRWIWSLSCAGTLSPYRKGERPKARAKQSIAWYSDDKTVSTLSECLPKVTWSCV
jgi:hypothetical protein